MPRAAAIPAAERRAHAVQALVELAASTAPDQISTAAIAERMGVSHGALFRHFPSRDALWAETVAWAIHSLEQGFAEACPSEGDPLAAIEALLECHVRFHQSRPGLLRMFFAELQRPETSQARERGKQFMAQFRDRLTGLISTAQRQGQLDPALPPQELACLLLSAIQGLLMQSLMHNELEQLPEQTRSSLRLILQGAGGSAARAASKS